MADDLKISVDKNNCRPQISTAAGPARLAVIDSNGNLLSIENIEGRITNAVIDAMLNVIDPVTAQKAAPKLQ